MTTLAPDNSLAIKTRRIMVPLGARSYEVLIGEGLVDRAGDLIAETFAPRRLFVVTDETVAGLHLSRLQGSLGQRLAGVHVLPSGEVAKSWDGLIGAVDAILAAELERADAVIAFGGGVVGDLAGFSAAVARRGMPFVQVPTTLLAQVDSSVGGKTGINTAHGKNLVGAFHQPRLVLADTDLLITLSERERRAGYAEIVKIALINDSAFFERLDALPRPADEELAASIATAVAAKAMIVAADEREAGERALLNLGHTFAHAVERIGGYDGRILHGEAVALGLCLAFRFSAALGYASDADAVRVAAHMARLGLPSGFGDIAVPCTRSAMMAAMAQDKKVQNGVIRFILTRGIGQAFVSRGAPTGALDAFLSSEGLPAS